MAAPSSNTFPEAVDEFLLARSTAKPSPHTLAAYRADLLGIAAHLSGESDPDKVTLDSITIPRLRGAFAAFAETHAKTSVRRAWSAWNSFYSHLVADGRVEGNPMGAIAQPKRPSAPVKVIRGTDVVGRLLAAAGTPDPKTPAFWPERDVALLATFAVTGLRLAEVLSLCIGSFDGPPGQRRLTVVGKGDKVRAIPLWSAYEELVNRYLRARHAQFPRQDIQAPTTVLFVSVQGEPLRRHQVQYLVEQLYRRAGMRAQVPPGALVHALRHTFATTALEGGASVLEVSQLLGHASLDTTRRYLEATANELRDSIKAHPAQVAVRAYIDDGGG